MENGGPSFPNDGHFLKGGSILIIMSDSNGKIRPYNNKRKEMVN